jgi:hypothetical protein
MVDVVVAVLRISEGRSYSKFVLVVVTEMVMGDATPISGVTYKSANQWL